MINIPTPEDIEMLAAEAGISTSNACRRAGLSYSMVARWKAGANPGIEAVRAVVVVLKKAIVKPPREKRGQRANALFRPAVVDRAMTRVGGGAALAQALGLSRQAVSYWSKVPKKHVLAVSELTGIPPHTLRPDCFKRTRSAV